MAKRTLKLIKNDPWLTPYSEAIEGRFAYAQRREKDLVGDASLSDFANGHHYFGLHRQGQTWVFREWAPHASAIYLVGDFNEWKKSKDYALHALENGVWEITLDQSVLTHGQHYKLWVEWPSGSGERIPAWAQRVVQDEQTKLFSAQVWDGHYDFQHQSFRPRTSPLLIYECHIGMAVEEERVGSYDEFRRCILPRIARNGYNAIQIMAIQEHPYYGSFGYHVSSFFAPSSRFGTPEELKQLIDEAHGLGIAVIMDIVHSHSVKNTDDGIGLLDGSLDQYFHSDERRFHPAWDSLCFNYGRKEVLHFLLSNCRYWMEEFHFDGFRFDGVTSMIYRSHGLGDSFGSYADYYNLNQDGDAICYLTLANKLIHEINPKAITIAEEVSGMPGLAVAVKDGGIGFDYRMAMGIPDFWIKLIKEQKDEDWKPSAIWWELTNRRADEKTVSYAESHDQALVGDKTIIFRLIDADMYWHMQQQDANYTVDRGIALHKMIRLLCLATINGAYLNFMGNEFGHPEWIDFPREGNGWSHKYARRQWSLADDPRLKYRYLQAFDNAMIALVKSSKGFLKTPAVQRCLNDGDQILAFERGNLLFVFNLHPNRSFDGYGIRVSKGSYRVVLNSDSTAFGGFGLCDDAVTHDTQADDPANQTSDGLEWIRLYLPARSAVVLSNHN